MPKLSDAPGTGSVTNRQKFVPFTAFLRIVPDKGKRQETVYSALKMAVDNAEYNLQHFCSVTEEPPFDIALPISITPQFGNKPYRLTVHGNACPRATFTKTPVGVRSVDNDNQKKTGPGAANRSNEVPDAELNSLAKSIKTNIESLTGFEVYRLELAHFIYGISGVHFPL